MVNKENMEKEMNKIIENMSRNIEELEKMNPIVDNFFNQYSNNPLMKQLREIKNEINVSNNQEDILKNINRLQDFIKMLDKDANKARPGGRVILVGGRLIRYAQDDDPSYGNQLRAFEITELSTESYVERELLLNPPLKGTGWGWNADGMHNIDPHQIEKERWIACVDGCVFPPFKPK